MKTIISTTRLKETEKGLQEAVVQELSLRGHQVFETGKTRRKVVCPTCKTNHYPTGYQGNTPFTPDLFVGIGGGLFVGIELKTEEGRVSDGQKDMAKNGVYSVCRSVEEVVKLVKSLGRK